MNQNSGLKPIALICTALMLLLVLGVADAATLTDTSTMTAGVINSTPFKDGFISGSIGSMSPATTSAGFAYSSLVDISQCGPKGGCSWTATFSVTGFKADPGKGWLTSVTANGQVRTGASAGYSYSNGTAGWGWGGAANHFGFTSGKYAVTVVHSGVVGYIDPKFVVVGVTYAPPGPSTNTFVNYIDSTLVGNTTSLSQSFGSSVTNSISLSAGYAVAVSKGSITTTTSTTTGVTTKNSSSVTTSFQVQGGEKTFGTGNYFAPVDHDYDMIWVWLNPALIFTVGPSSVVWNGYGYDTTDQPSPDIVPIALGYLNGHFGSIPTDIQTSFNRAWAASQKWGPGEGPALTSADLAKIAAADPFSVSTYGSTYIGYTPPSPETADHRFTLSACSSNSSFDYLQANPSQAAAINSCTLTYANTSTAAQDITSTYSQSYSVDVSVSATFTATFSADLKTSYTLTWITDAQKSITSTTTSSGALSIQGPACNNVVLDTGPCVPVYDAAGNEPTQFEVYQDNMYGTFMFAPIHFY